MRDRWTWRTKRTKALWSSGLFSFCHMNSLASSVSDNKERIKPCLSPIPIYDKSKVDVRRAGSLPSLTLPSVWKGQAKWKDKNIFFSLKNVIIACQGWKNQVFKAKKIIFTIKAQFPPQKFKKGWVNFLSKNHFW